MEKYQTGNYFNSPKVIRKHFVAVKSILENTLRHSERDVTVHITGRTGT